MFKNLYNYRELLGSNIKKEIRGKYKGSFLGVLWSFVNPLLMTLIYAIVFPFILKNNEPHYVTFLIIGILPWTFFTTVISQGTYCILANAGIIKKVYFPREVLPISIVCSGLVNFLISCIIIFIFLMFSHIGFSIHLLWLPIVVIAQFLLLLGLIFITSAINVYIRDAEYIINFIVNMLFYITPILYNSEMFSGTSIEWVIKMNPMATIIMSYRDILYYQSIPHLKALFMVLLGSIVLVYIGYQIFKKMEKGFAEEV